MKNGVDTLCTIQRVLCQRPKSKLTNDSREEKNTCHALLFVLDSYKLVIFIIRIVYKIFCVQRVQKPNFIVKNNVTFKSIHMVYSQTFKESPTILKIKPT